MIEAFSSVLSGAAIGSSIGSMYKDLGRPQDVGHFFCLIDVEAFMDLATFTSRMDRMIDEIKASPRRPGVDEILVPGERSSRVALENARRGISIGEETVAELGALCQELGVRYSLSP
jgi:LDH2 family malate/lactate/ureidoglycolate dehydrogenase